jgi:hypothetical protein
MTSNSQFLRWLMMTVMTAYGPVMVCAGDAMKQRHWWLQRLIDWLDSLEPYAE